MFQLIVINKSGQWAYADYHWEARINNQVLQEGEILGFERTLGWKELIKQILEESELE